MANLPSGTVTLLFTDIEGSTRHWEQHPKAMNAAITRHDEIVRGVIEANGGYVFKTVGDAFCAAFHTPHDALQAALSAQRALDTEHWSDETGPIRVRMALHIGAIEERDGDYFGPPISRVVRLLSAGHGGQVLLSMGTKEMVCDNLPDSVTLLDLKEHQLKDLIRPEHIFQVVAPDLPSRFPPLKTLNSHTNNLPRQVTTLIGREKEIEVVCALLRRADVRLLTLTGPGGTGKTRLGLQAAADLVDSFENGTFFVNLAPIRDPNLVVSTIAQTLDIKEEANRPLVETLKNYLESKQLLLLLDNFEQVVKAGPQISQVLAGCAKLKVLATSRVPLHIQGEKMHLVPPMALPDPRQHPSIEQLTQYEAVRLFIERATEVKRDFEVTNANAPAVAEICVRLDGLPLAIELAAARVRLLPPQAILARLVGAGPASHSGNTPLRLLTGGARDLPARHQTLRNTIEWSHDLLDKGEQQLFRRLSTFQGGCTLEAIEAVCAVGVEGEGRGVSNDSNHKELSPHPPPLTPLEIDVLDGVESLVSKSLLQQREGEGGEPHFIMLETIHEYAREKLEEGGEAEVLWKQHAMYYTTLAEEAEPQLIGPQQANWLALLGEEHDNMRAAMHWAKESSGDVEIGLRLVGAFWRFWFVRGYYSEGREQLARMLALSASERSDAHRAKALNGSGTLAWSQGDYAAAYALYDESLSIRRQLGDKEGITNSLNGLGNVVFMQGDYTTARSLYEENLSLQRELGDKRGTAISLQNLGLVAWNQGDYATARSLYEESLVMLRGLGDKQGIANFLNNMGNASWYQQDYATARSLHEESLSIYRELGDKRGIAIALGSLGVVACWQGDYDTARSLHKESLSIRRELGDRRGIAICLLGLGALTVKIGQVQQAQAEWGTRLLGAAEALLGTVSAVTNLESHERMVYEQGIASTRAQLDEATWKKAWAEGSAMSMEQAVVYALRDA